MRTRPEPTTGTDSRLQDLRRPYPMACPPSPASTLEGKERCLTFEASPVGDEEIMDEWRDVGVFEDKEGMEEGLSAAGSSVPADEGTSGWRDLACCSDREGTEDSAGRTD